MLAENTCRFEELEGGVLAVVFQPKLNDVPWVDIEQVGAAIVDQVAARPTPKVIVDLGELTHMGSAILALVVRVWKTVEDLQGKMIAVIGQAGVAEVLDISGLTGKWKIVPSRDDALTAFGVAKTRRGTSGANAKTDTAAAARTGADRTTANTALATIGAGLLALVACLLLADGMAGGLIAGLIGRVPVLLVAVCFSAPAVLLGGTALFQTAGRMRIHAVAYTAVALIATIAAVVLVSVGDGGGSR